MYINNRKVGDEGRNSMKVEFNGVCDKGLHRQTNQDKLYMKSKGRTALFAIADGMGGHMHGEYASEHIITELRKWYELFDENCYNGKFDNMVFSIRCVLEQVNGKVFDSYGKDVMCGSTVVVLFSCDNQYAVLWAGDSRAYLLNGWKTKLLTVDDVWENQLEIKRNFTMKQMKDCIHYGKLVNAIGIGVNAKINIKTDLIKKGACFLLCSDGLYKMCSEKEIRKMVDGYKGTDTGDILMLSYLNRVYDKGAKDNVSFIIVVYK